VSEFGQPEGPQVLPAARDLIGRVTFQKTFDPVSPRMIKEYVAGTGDWKPMHVDEAGAAAGRHGRIVAPALFFQAVCRDVVPESQLLEDGQHRTLGVEGVTGRSVLAGQDIELFEPVHVGDVLTLRETLVSITEKEGRSGPLVIVVTDETYSKTGGRPVARSTTTRIFR
jgi:acyl dehydratase